jgi:hypothetical protein
MRDIFTFLAVAIPIAGVIPYVINTAKGKTQPNIVTWFTWSLINGINAGAALSSGAIQTGIYSAAGFIATISIVAVGLKYGTIKYTRFDITCQILALLGIPLWLLTSQPALAVLIVMLVDIIGGLPTLVHSWKKPTEETWQTFALSALGGALLLVSLSEYTFISLAMPAYILVFDSLILVTLFLRRSRA